MGNAKPVKQMKSKHRLLCLTINSLKEAEKKGKREEKQKKNKLKRKNKPSKDERTILKRQKTRDL